MSLGWARVDAYSWVGLGMLGLALGGCFRDTSTLARQCDVGTSTCPCFGDGTCVGDLVCEADSVCRSLRCQDGRAECACRPGGGCDAGLECVDGSCLEPDGTTTQVTSDTSADSTTETSAGPTSGSASATSMDVTSTTSDGTTLTSLETGAESEVTSGVTTEPTDGCICGDRFGYAECVWEEFRGPGVVPQCPADMQYGDPCDAFFPPLDGEGCCAGDGQLFYCVQEQVFGYACVPGNGECS